MTHIFAVYQDKDDIEQAKRFHNYRELWEWLQEWQDDYQKYPGHLLIFEASCVFDGSH